MKKSFRTSITALAAAGLTAALAGAAPAQMTPQQRSAADEQWQRTYRDFTRGIPGERLTGQRLDQLRFLAQRLDASAREAAQRAAAGASGARERRLLPSVNDFARRAGTLSARLNGYPSAPFDVQGELAALDQIAQQVDVRMRVSSFQGRAVDAWQRTLETMRAMQQTFAQPEARERVRYRY